MEGEKLEQTCTFDSLERIEVKIDSLRVLLEPITCDTPTKTEENRQDRTKLESKLNLIEMKLNVMLETITL